MADVFSNLPLEITHHFDVLVSPASSGMSLRRQRWPRPATQRTFKLTAEHMEMSSELAAILIALDLFLGAAMPFPVTLPNVGTVTVRNADDGWSYQVANGTLRHFSLRLIEEPRIA